MVEYFFYVVLMVAFGIISMVPFLLLFALLFNIWNTDFYGAHKGD